MFTKQLGRIAAVLLASMMVTSVVFAASLSSAWPSAGHDLQNSRNQSSESKINSTNVSNLAKQWAVTTSGDVSATPALDGANAYFPDKGGMLWAVSLKTGATVWSHKVSDYTGLPGDYARDTPAIIGNELILGDQAGYAAAGAPASVFAVNKQTGALIWKTVVESVGFPIVTQSAVIDQSTNTPVAYIGVASAEELFAGVIPGYTCCSARGSILAINALTGQIMWKTYTVPQGYSGGSVWGSTAVIDYRRNSLYIGTGNNYSLPPAVLACVEAASNVTQAAGCLSPDDHFDSVMALDMNTGQVKWASAGVPYDSFNVSCFAGAVLGTITVINGYNCPVAGPDFDFGQGPTLYSASMPGGGSAQLLGAGQKSGVYWAFNPDTGAVVWKTQVGPGGSLGGLEWGSAMDGSRIYVADSNNYGIPWTPVGSTTPVTSGGWSALDPATGKILWQTPDPLGAIDPGAVSSANGVVYACSMDPQGHMYALDGSTGAIKWSFASGGSCNAGAAISNGVVYWGSGYRAFGTANNKFFAFGLP